MIAIWDGTKEELQGLRVLYTKKSDKTKDHGKNATSEPKVGELWSSGKSKKEPLVK